MLNCLTLFYLYVFVLSAGRRGRRPPTAFDLCFSNVIILFCFSLFNCTPKFEAFVFLYLIARQNLRHLYKCLFHLFYFYFLINYLCVCVCVCVCVYSHNAFKVFIHFFTSPSFVFGHGTPCPYPFYFI